MKASTETGLRTVYPCERQDIASQKGLTKRELFAAMAMQGLLANTYGASSRDPMANDGGHTKQAMASHAVAFADALLAALETK